MTSDVKVALVDDHVLLRKGLADLVRKLGFSVSFEGDNGKDMINKIDKQHLPDVVLMDISMPEMDGFETTLWLKKNHPFVNVLALSMYDEETSIIRMLKNGAKGYILKDSDPAHLKIAIDTIVSKGFHYTEMVTGKMVHRSQHMDEDDTQNKLLLSLNEKEIQFLKLASTELTYKEIAREMHLSPRTIDGYRDALFERLNAKSRIGLVLFTIKNGIIQLDACT